MNNRNDENCGRKRRKIVARISSSPRCVLPPNNTGHCRSASLKLVGRLFTSASDFSLRPLGSYLILPTARIRSRATPIATHRSTSSGSCAQTRSNRRNVGATKNRNRRNLRSDLGDKRALHDRRVIERRVHDVNPARNVLISQSETGCGGRR